MSVERDLPALEQAWRSFESHAVGHAFQTYDFAAPWMQLVGHGRGASACIIVGRSANGAIVFLLPFATFTRLGRRAVEWIGGESADYGCGLFDADYLKRLATRESEAESFRHEVLSVLRAEADFTHLARQPTMIGNLPNPLPGQGMIRNSDSSHQTELGGDWERYYRAKRNSNSRRNDRSKFRRLDSLGEVRLFDAVTPADIDRVMDALFEQKQSQLRRMGIRGMFASEGVKSFYRALAHSHYPNGLTHVAGLEVGGQILATNWGLVRNNRYYYVMHSYDENAAGARFSPGRCLMYHLMQWCVRRGIDTFDFTIGDEGYKAQWCETSHRLYDSVMPLGMRGLDVTMTLRAGKPLKRFVKANDQLRTVAVRLRRSLAGT